MAWEKVKLGDIADVTSSKRVFANQYVDKGIPFYRQKEIIERNNKQEISDPLFISQDLYDDIKKKYGVPQKNDLLITGVGATLGIPYVIGNETFYFKDGNLIWVKNFSSKADSKYIYYYMSSGAGQKAMWSRTIGAAQPALTIDIVKQYEIPLPDIKIQKRIADILSAYDNLIENNQKQIKLLEEAAQRLYKQWFIDLRFPGHETTKIVDGLPEGWRKGSIGDIAEFKRGKVITKGDVVEGNVPVVAGGLEPAYYHNASFTESPVITVSGSGANAGFARMYFQKIWASDCSYVDSSATIFIYFVYSFLKENKKSLDSLQKGAAQPHVYAKDINALKLNCPPKDLLVKFEKSVKPLFDKIGKCQNVIEKSKDARDRLLPKLMSKKMEV
ncbi:restriction endonuclease subunit S [uncultured Fibrobacter sp.]|uniref:restriction endonuclease subunit S n=1 Tax=uncultured Fibrobacter sp. TaxID=261512 RepID=UPI0025CDD088|nr:restriction endonuclease subunit S [uncultured Fibrobacter sp.]